MSTQQKNLQDLQAYQEDLENASHNQTQLLQELQDKMEQQENTSQQRLTFFTSMHNESSQHFKNLKKRLDQLTTEVRNVSFKVKHDLYELGSQRTFHQRK